MSNLQIAMLFLLCQTTIPLLSNGKPHSLSTWQRDEGLLAPNDKNVGQSRGKGIANSIFDVDNIEGTMVTLTVGDVTNTTQVTSTNNHDQMSIVELDGILDLA